MKLTLSENINSVTRVIGVGNEFRSDDGVGIYVSRRLRKMNLPAIRSIEYSGEGVQLIELWKGQHTVIIVDSVSSGNEPGTVFRYDVNKQQVPSKFFRYSSHDFGLAEAIKLSRTLSTLPKRLIVYGIEGKNYSQGSDISPKVRTTAEYVIDFIIAEVEHSFTKATMVNQ